MHNNMMKKTISNRDRLPVQNFRKQGGSGVMHRRDCTQLVDSIRAVSQFCLDHELETRHGALLP